MLKGLEVDIISLSNDGKGITKETFTSKLEDNGISLLSLDTDESKGSIHGVTEDETGEKGVTIRGRLFFKDGTDFTWDDLVDFVDSIDVYFAGMSKPVTK